MGSAYERLPLPSGVPVPMCYCGDRCKVAKSDEEDTYRQRYWMCDNFAFEPTPRQIRIGLLVNIYVLSTLTLILFEIMCEYCVTMGCFVDPSPLCDFVQWIDTKIKEEDKRYMELCKKWEAERLETVEKRRQEEEAEKERQEELQRRLATERMEERE